MFSQLRSEIFADITYIFENEDYVIDSVVWRTMVVIGIGQVLEECQEVGNAFSFKWNLGVVEMLRILLGRHCFILVLSLSLFWFFHLS